MSKASPIPELTESRGWRPTIRPASSMYYTHVNVEFPTREFKSDFPDSAVIWLRSKPVKNLFELANVASIALHPHWGEDRKEAELLNKDSRYLTTYTLISNSDPCA
ncbi:toxin-antitoxin system, antitoxin component, AbrB domain protein [Ostertagia ostertagi]